MSESSLKSLVGRKMTKKVKFMGQDIAISKLSVAEVLEIQKRAKDINDNETQGFDVLKVVIQKAVENAEDLTDEDFEKFPLDELSKLSNEIMSFSGINTDSGK